MIRRPLSFGSQPVKASIGRFDSDSCEGGLHLLEELLMCPVRYCVRCGACFHMGREVDWKPEMERAPVPVLQIMRALREG